MESQKIIPIAILSILFLLTPVLAIQATSVPIHIIADAPVSNLTVIAYNSSDCTEILYNETFVNRFTNGEAFVTIGENATNLLRLNFNNHSFYEFYADDELLNFTDAIELASNDNTCLKIRAGQGQVGIEDIVSLDFINDSATNLNNTYASFWYNYTPVALSFMNDSADRLNNTYASFWYNETLVVLSFVNDSTTILNTTYADLWYNHTLNALAFMNDSADRLNTTYASFWYNNTIPAINALNDTYADFWYNTSLHNIFDQLLNTTDNAIFNFINVTENITVLADNSYCFVADCSKHMFGNATGVYIQG